MLSVTASVAAYDCYWLFVSISAVSIYSPNTRPGYHLVVLLFRGGPLAGAAVRQETVGRSPVSGRYGTKEGPPSVVLSSRRSNRSSDDLAAFRWLAQSSHRTQPARSLTQLVSTTSQQVLIPQSATYAINNVPASGEHEVAQLPTA